MFLSLIESTDSIISSCVCVMVLFRNEYLDAFVTCRIMLLMRLDEMVTFPMPNRGLTHLDLERENDSKRIPVRVPFWDLHDIPFIGALVREFPHFNLYLKPSNALMTNGEEACNDCHHGYSFKATLRDQGLSKAYVSADLMDCVSTVLKGAKGYGGGATCIALQSALLTVID